MYRNRFLILAIAALMVVLVVPHRADAALRLTVSEGALTDVFYASSNTSLGTETFTIGDYTAQIQSVVTNFPGGAAAAVSQTVNIGSISATPAANLISQVDVVANAGAPIDPAGPTGLAPLTGTALTTVTGLGLSSWTAPTGSPLILTSDTGAAHNATVSSGTTQNTAIFNGTNYVSGVLTLTAATDQFLAYTVSPGAPYTLSNSVDLSGVNASAIAVNYTGTSSLIATPEPGTIAMALTGLPILGLLWARRRRRA